MPRGGFLVAGGSDPDLWNHRRHILRSGDVEPNPGPGHGVCCASCGQTMGTYRGPLRCEARCGAVSHRREACSGLIRVDQDRGIWCCPGCLALRANSIGRGVIAPSVGVGAVGPVPTADALQGGVAQIASSEDGQVESQRNLVITDGELAVISTTRELAAISTNQELTEGMDLNPCNGGQGGGLASITIRERTNLLAEAEDSARTAVVVVEEPAGALLAAPPAVPNLDHAAPVVGVNPPVQAGGAGRTNETPERGEGVQSPSLPGRRNLPNGDGGTPPNRGRGQARQSPIGGGAAPVNSPRARQQDRPAGGRKCPTCNMRLAQTRTPLVCNLCHSEHHKKCSGLTRLALHSWQRDQQWVCGACTARSRQAPTHTPNVDTVAGSSPLVTSRSSLKVIHWNVDGLSTSLVDLHVLVEREPDIDVLMVQETKLLPTAPDPRIPGYVGIRRDRPTPPRGGGARGGGLMTFVKEDLPHRLVDAYSGDEHHGTECLAVEIQLSQGRKLTLVNIYRAPNREGGQGRPSFDHIRVPVTPFVFAGDWNAHSPLWDDSQPGDRWGDALEEWAMDNPMAVLNTGAHTRVNRATGGLSAPDVSLVHTSLVDRADWEVLSLLSSDHCPIKVTLGIDPVVVEEPESRLKWDWRNADWEGFGSAVDLSLRNAQAEAAQENVQLTMDEKADILQEAMEAAARTHVGKVRVKSEGRKWVTPELRAAIRRRNWLGRRFATHRDEWVEACRVVRELTIGAKAESWRSFVESLEGRAGSSRVWGVIRSLNGKPSQTDARNSMLEFRGKAIYDPVRKADAFCQQYAAVSRHSFSRAERDTNRRVRQELTRARCEAGPVGQESSDFSLGELQAALKASKAKGAAGPDEICPQFLRNLKEDALDFVLGIFNESWVRGYCPQTWRDAVIVPVPKPGKPAGVISSYRPIALTSCLAKLMERLVANRLKHIAEDAGLWCKDQAGFRAQRCTEDQVLKLSQSVLDGFQCKKPKRTVLALLDFSKAYDTIWRADLLNAMMRKGVPPRFVLWIKALLTNRQANVRLGGVQSKNRLFREGVPQGSVLSPLLFLFVIDTLRDRLPDGLNVSLFADDVAIWASDPCKGVAASKVEEGVRAVYDWSREKKLTLSIEKCEVSFFTSSTSEFGWQPSVVVEGRALPFNPTPKFLGVKYDRMFSFADQVKEAASKMAKGSRMLRALASSDWGWRSGLLLKVYISAVQSGSDYCAAGWQPWLSDAGKKTLSQARNKCLRAITGQYSTSPEDAPRLELGLVSTSTSICRHAALAYEKSMRLPAENPRAELAQQRVPYKWRRNRGWRRLAKEAVSDLGLADFPRRPLPPPTSAPWAVGGDDWEVCLWLMGGSSRNDPPDRVLRDALATVRTYAPLDAVFYTDGSCEGGFDHGGSAMVETSGDPGHPTFLAERSQAGPRYASSFETEAYALDLCVSLLAERQAVGRYLICSDSQSALAALKGGELKDHPILWGLREKLRSLRCSVAFQWVPGHVGLPGNERANQVAREVARQGRDGVLPQAAGVTFRSAKLSIKRGVVDGPTQHDRLRQVYQGPVQHPQGLSRKEEVLLARLRSGHSLHLASYRDRVHGSGDTCHRCGEPETLQHFMQECQASEATRVRVFGVSTPPLSVLSGDPNRVLQYLRELRLL